MAIGSNSSCAQYTAPPRAPDEVSTSWKAGQILSIRLTTPSPAVTGSVLATFLISVTASFKRWQARCEPLHPNARARSRDLNVQVCFAGIDRRYFGIRRVHGRRRMKRENACRTKMPMETAEILHQFERATGKFARAAVEAAVARQEEITPELLRILEETVDRAAQLDAEGDYMAHLYAMFLLGAVPRNPRLPACGPLCIASGRSPGFSLRRLHHGKPWPGTGVSLWRRVGRHSVSNRE